MGWGESWEKKVSLVASINNEQLESEKKAIQDLVQDSTEVDDLFDLETRAQAVVIGVVASENQIKQGRDHLRSITFPSLAKLFAGYRKSALSSKVWELANDCHEPDSGRFCDGDGDSSGEEKSGFFKKLFGRDSEGRTWQDRKNEQFEKIVESEKIKKNTPKFVDPNKNSFGFTPQQLDEEKSKISAQFKAADKSMFNPTKKVFDQIDAETRAKAVLQGRIASKAEIKKGRSDAAAKNWGALILLGIIAK